MAFGRHWRCPMCEKILKESSVDLHLQVSNSTLIPLFSHLGVLRAFKDTKNYV
jgi:hypothetical protein